MPTVLPTTSAPVTASSGDVDARARRRDVIAAVLLLSPAFWLRIFIGTDASSYADYPGVSLSFLGYLCHVALVGYALLSGRLMPTFGQAIALVLFLLLAAIQLGNLDARGIVGMPEAALPLLRGCLWLAAIWSFLALSSRPDALIDVFVAFAKFTSVAIVCCLVFYLMTGIAFGVYVAGEAPRAHAFLTEPSGVAYVVPVLAALMLYRGSLGWLAVSAVAAVASLSVLTVSISVVVAGIGLLVRFRRTVSAVLVVAALTVAAALIPALISTDAGRDAVAALAQLAEQRGATVERGGVVTDEIVLRVLGAFEELDRQLNRSDPDEYLGPLARLFGMIRVFDELHDAGARWIGYGLNVYGYVQTRESAEALLDFGYPSFLFSSFGVLFGSGLLILTLLTTSYCLFAKPKLGLLLAGFVVATLANSAAGIHAYAIPMMAALAPFVGTGLFAERGCEVVAPDRTAEAAP